MTGWRRKGTSGPIVHAGSRRAAARLLGCAEDEIERIRSRPVGSATIA